MCIFKYPADCLLADSSHPNNFYLLFIIYFTFFFKLIFVLFLVHTTFSREATFDTVIVSKSLEFDNLSIIS
jgi:hypothetical protein